MQHPEPGERALNVKEGRCDRSQLAYDPHPVNLALGRGALGLPAGGRSACILVTGAYYLVREWIRCRPISR